MVLLESNHTLKTGQKAPDFDLPGIDGSRHSLSSYGSYEGVLVIFMCNHCPYVKAKIEAIKEIYQTYGKAGGQGFKSPSVHPLYGSSLIRFLCLFTMIA